MEDLTLRRLTKKVFPYIWLRHKLMSCIPSTGIFPFSEMTVFSQAVGNAVIVYLHAYRPILSNYLEKHIPSMPQSKMNFWTHVAFLCLQVRLSTDDVFDYFLTTCAITAEVALHCYMSGYDYVLPLASVFFCAFFEIELYKGFHNAGGWVGLHQYIKDTSCPELYEMVNVHIKRISSPSEHLPILIMIKCEVLAAERREKFMSLRSFKFFEIEREDQTESLVSGILHWDFMENQRISEVRPGILKRMGNVRHRKNTLNISIIGGERSDESSEADEVLDADNKISDADKLLCLPDEAQTLESAATMFETRSNYKDGQTSDDLKCTDVGKENENQLCASNETSGKAKYSSSSNLRELRNFYESLSAKTEATMDDSKCFKSNDGTRIGMNTSAIKGKANKCEKVSGFKRYPKFSPCASENGETFPKSENCTPIKSAESLHIDALAELKNSFQELGFNCLCVGKSSHLDEKLTNYSEIMQKCSYFQSKYPSIQFAILIPNDYFIEKTSHAPRTENCNEIHFDRQCNGQQFPRITKQDFEHCTVSPQGLHSETKESKHFVAKMGENQSRNFFNEPSQLQNCPVQSIQNSRFVVKKVEENDFTSQGEDFKISRFSVTKVNENHMIPRNEANLLENTRTVELTKVSRFRVEKVNENQSKDQMTALHKNWTSETTKTSRFNVTKINENKSKDGTFEKKCSSETSKISRFTVTKIDENLLKDGTSILGRNLANERTKISRFTVTKVNESKSKDPTSILRRRRPHETIRPSRFTFDNQLMPRAGTSLMGKSYPTNTTKISRFSVTKVDGSQCRSSERNSISEISDTENETVQFQGNGSVKYQKRVSFAEHPLISYYHQYSSDDSCNSKTSVESFVQNSPEDCRSSSKSGQSDNQEDTSRTPTLRNTAMSEKRRLFRRNSFSDIQSSRDNARSSNTSFGFNFLGRIFRRSNSRNNKVNESPMEEMQETSQQKIDELTMSLKAAGIEDPVVFKI